MQMGLDNCIVMCYTIGMNERSIMKRTTIWVNKQDREAIQIIRDRYGLSSNSSTIRFALRILAHPFGGDPRTEAERDLDEWQREVEETRKSDRPI